MNVFNQQWKTPPADLKWSEDEIHVWQASLNIPVADLSLLHQFLSQEEVAKAKQFYFEKNRHHYVGAHGILRILLSRYLNTSPDQLRFDYNAYGKPSLAFPFRESTVTFNMSHAHEIALYVFAHTRQVGIDVEYICSDIEYEQLAKYSFSPNELAVFCALPAALKQQAFFNCWTRKEAYIKAKGKGLSLPLEQFDVSLSPDEPATLLESREVPSNTKQWLLQELCLDPGYVGALAIEGSGWQLSCWKYS